MLNIMEDHKTNKKIEQEKLEVIFTKMHRV